MDKIIAIAVIAGIVSSAVKAYSSRCDKKADSHYELEYIQA